MARINAASRPGEGFTFTMTFPAQPPILISPIPNGVPLVDDDITTNFLNKLLLTTLRVTKEMLIAQNGAKALRIL